MSMLTEMGKQAKEAAVVLSVLPTPRKNKALCHAADALLAAKDEILAANKADVEAAVEAGIKGAFIDRLTLTEKRLEEMADGLRQVASLDDPVGKVLSMKTLDNGLIIGQKRVPMGVIGIIFEARPNVTADAFGLCLKAGSAVILRGGKEAIGTNKKVVSVFQKALEEEGLPGACVQIVQDTNRETANEMMRLNGYLDLLIPRGGAGLIQNVVQNSTVPVIQTGVGNCHVYVDESADLEKAVRIVINAKTQRPGVCNACESLLVHESLKDTFLPMIGEALQEKQVEKLISQKVDALAISPIDSYYTPDYLDEIREKNITAVTFDTGFSGEEIPYIGIDNYMTGYKLAQQLAEEMDHQGEVGVVAGNMEQKGHRERVEGFEEYMSTEPQMSVQFVESGYANLQMSEQKVRDLMTHYPKIKGIMATSAVTAMGLVDELKDTEIKIVAIDEQEDSLKAVEEGTIKALAAQSGYEIGYETIHYIQELRNGKKLEKEHYLDVEILTQDNIKAYRRNHESQKYKK